MIKKIILITLLSLTHISTSLADNCVHASWYGPGFHGKKTASGERFNQNDMTAAHKNLNFGTKLRVVNPKNNKYVVVKINDRGPYTKGRGLDLSKAAANQLDIKDKGRGLVCYKIIE